MLDHQAPILDDFNTRLGQLLGDRAIGDSGLHPNDFRLLRQNVVEVGRHILGPAKDVHHINFYRYIDQLPINRLSQYLGHLRVVNGNRNYFEACRSEIPWDIERGLVRLRFSLNPKHRNRLRGCQQVADLCALVYEILLPVHYRKSIRRGACRNAIALNAFFIRQAGALTGAS
jgi:hypothetical protein